MLDNVQPQVDESDSGQEPEMVAAVLPVGHALGGFYGSADDEAPRSYEVRTGEEVVELTATQFLVWLAAHGQYPEGQPAKVPPTRPTIEKLAREQGADHVNVAYKALLNEGLLVSVLPVKPALRKFAQEYRVAPLADSLGNSPDRLELIELGYPGAPRIRVGYQVFQVWAFTSEYASLWDVCQALAAGPSVEGAPTDPDVLLKIFFDALPVLVSVSCAYIDRRKP